MDKIVLVEVKKSNKIDKAIKVLSLVNAVVVTSFVAYFYGGFIVNSIKSSIKSNQTSREE